MRPPRYYDKFYEENFPEKMLDIKQKREQSASIQSLSIENTLERMNVKHQIALIHSKKNSRDLRDVQLHVSECTAPQKAYDEKVIKYNEEAITLLKHGEI